MLRKRPSPWKFPKDKSFLPEDFYYKIPFNFSAISDFECMKKKPANTNTGKQTTTVSEQKTSIGVRRWFLN